MGCESAPGAGAGSKASQQHEALFPPGVCHGHAQVVAYIVTRQFRFDLFQRKLEEDEESQERVHAYLTKAIQQATGMSTHKAELQMLLQRITNAQQTPVLSQCLIRNRINQLDALAHSKAAFHVRVPPRKKESQWMLKMDPMALTASPYAWQYLGTGFTKISYKCASLRASLRG